MTDRDLNVRIKTTGAQQAAGEIDDVAEAAGAAEGDWISTFKADNADAIAKANDVIDRIDEIDGADATAKVDVDVKGDPQRKLGGIAGELSRLPGAAGEAATAIEGVFNRAAGAIGGAMAAIGVAMAAWKIYSDRAKQHLADVQKIIDEMAGASDKQLVDYFNRIIMSGTLGKDVGGAIASFAKDDLVSARRLRDLKMSQGDTQYLAELNAAIREEERRQRQRGADEERYGGDPVLDNLPSVAPRGRASGGSTYIVYNPPGSSTTINGAQREYDDLNGVRRLP